MPVNAVRLHASESPKETSSQSALSECVSRTVRRYLADIGDTECDEGLHALVIREVEGPLLREVLAWHDCKPRETTSRDPARAARSAR